MSRAKKDVRWSWLTLTVYDVLRCGLPPWGVGSGISINRKTDLIRCWLIIFQMSILDDFLIYIQGLIHQNLQLRQSFQPILAWMHRTALENIQLDQSVKNLRLIINVQLDQLKSLQEENAYLRRSFSTATIELERLHLTSQNPRDDIDSEAETVVL